MEMSSADPGTHLKTIQNSLARVLIRSECAILRVTLCAFHDFCRHNVSHFISFYIIVLWFVLWSLESFGTEIFGAILSQGSCAKMPREQALLFLTWGRDVCRSHQVTIQKHSEPEALARNRHRFRMIPDDSGERSLRTSWPSGWDLYSTAIRDSHWGWLFDMVRRFGREQRSRETHKYITMTQHPNSWINNDNDILWYWYNIYKKKHLLSLALKGELLECYGFQTGDALPHVKRVPAKS